MPRLHLLGIGDQITLEEQWSFWLYNESRNRVFSRKCGIDWEDPDQENPTLVTLPAGTILTTSRVYVKQGQKDYESITFSVDHKESKLKGRFWVKLEDANSIYYTET